ncbi:hypothetical protein BGZ80_001461 [Entomortierella chlamydospora]|uniref:glucan endo-1,3-beta-D-glucosidase n=1 Tax=Entomortierella chlamydospora TaxID=101097 RepID=A0A9P6MRN2_9FUNG|nr:hypothetical protein BGZ79_009690 [Entomortierella chlamydospora]KAG0010470.1 hypothetical protein BGZ80_001461 [Entomortierella chlamydospora]
MTVGSSITRSSSATGLTIPESTLVTSRRGSSPVGSREQEEKEGSDVLVCGAIRALVYKEQIFSTIKRSHHVGGGVGDADVTEKIQSIESKSHVNTTINPGAGLNKVFYGIDYTPSGSQEPYCTVNLGSVIGDAKVLSQLTNRIRIFNMACQQAESMLKAIEYLGLEEMQIILTLWVDNNSTSWENQKSILWNLIENDIKMDSRRIGDLAPRNTTSTGIMTLSKPVSKTSGISVGNEVLCRNGDNAKLDRQVPVQILTDYIDQIRKGLAARSKEASSSSDSNVVALGQQLKQIPIFSSGLGCNVYQIVDEVDEVMSNIHSFFAQVEINQAAPPS